MQITLGALLNKIVAAQQRMSRKNPHKLLLQQCAEVVIHLDKLVRQQDGLLERTFRDGIKSLHTALTQPVAGEHSDENRDAPPPAA